MPRVTKAELELKIEALERENNEILQVNETQARELKCLRRHLDMQNNYTTALKEEIQRLRDRERSPIEEVSDNRTWWKFW